MTSKTLIAALALVLSATSASVANQRHVIRHHRVYYNYSPQMSAPMAPADPAYGQLYDYDPAYGQLYDYSGYGGEPYGGYGGVPVGAYGPYGAGKP